MKLENSKILVIGGAGFIGSYVVKELLKEKTSQVVIYDNFARGKKEYLQNSLKDDRCSIFPIGGDIREIDILNKAPGIYSARWGGKKNNFNLAIKKVYKKLELIDKEWRKKKNKSRFVCAITIYGPKIKIKSAL